MKGMMIVKSFFERLKELRKKAGLTQTELAELVNMHETTIRRWENAKGIPRIEEIKKLAKALNVTEEELLNGDNSSKQWILQISTADKFKEDIDMSGKKLNCVSQMTITPNGAGLLLTGDWNIWGDTKQFKNLLKQLEKARDVILQNGKALGGLEI